MKKLFLIITAIIIICNVLVVKVEAVWQFTNTDTDFPYGREYYIKNAFTGKYMDVSG